VLIATGAAGNAPVTQSGLEPTAALLAGGDRGRPQLAQAIVRDGEGATKFITVRSTAGATRPNAAWSPTPSRTRRWSRPRSSPATPTSAASWPRSATPASTTSTRADRPDFWTTCMWRRGGRHPDYREEDGQRVMKQPRSPCASTCTAASASATVWTCDLSHDYVSINADYRS
jgi:glutamate N-acetyltransferase/amino-acid N-acetyltransferase